MDASQTPQDQTPPPTGTWLKLDARDPEAEAAEAAYLKESRRVNRGVWIGNVVSGLLVVGVLAGLGYVFIPKLGKPSGASAAEVIGTEDQRRDAVSLLATLNGQATMWKLQHYDRSPDFGQYPQWEQFVQPTTVSGMPTNGGIKAAGPMCGPYLDAKPANPLNGLTAVWVTSDEVAAGSPVGAGRPVGFVFNSNTLKFFATDVAGTRVIDPAAAPEAVAGKSAAAIAKDRQALESQLSATLTSLRDKLALYQQQHNGSVPDFDLYPNWDQLTGKTDAAGKISESGQFGPYVDRPLRNAYTGTARVQAVEKDPGLRFSAMSNSVGYVLDKSSGKIWAVDAESQLMASK